MTKKTEKNRHNIYQSPWRNWKTEKNIFFTLQDLIFLKLIKHTMPLRLGETKPLNPIFSFLPFQIRIVRYFMV